MNQEWDFPPRQGLAEMNTDPWVLRRPHASTHKDGSWPADPAPDAGDGRARSAPWEHRADAALDFGASTRLLGPHGQG